MTVTRRDVLTMTALTAAGSAIPSVARAQAPKRGGTLTLRGWHATRDHGLIGGLWFS